jgi:phenylalanyl-tRNA synthetase beta chain
LDDEVMSLDLTPNRADLLSVMGVAYDTAAILNKPIHLKEPKVSESKTPIGVTIELDTPHCLSYHARVIDNLTIAPSPQWLQSRLIAAGVRPINNVVDITNYVMLETGQPLHAFDFDRLKSDRIVVRQARTDEPIVTLDGATRHLCEDDIVITDGTNPVALGGVMGGESTEVHDGTTSILLESAVFDPVHIRKTSARLDLRSESSMRFERKVDPARTRLALERASELFEQLAGGIARQGIAVVDHTDPTPKQIELPTATVNAYLGTDLSTKEVGDVLRRLSFETTEQQDNFLVLVPSRRQDITTYQDLIEEVGRIVGYDRLPTTLPATTNEGRLSEYQIFQRQLKNRLNGLGLHEVVTYALVPEDRAHDFTPGQEPATRVLMPMSQDRSTLTLSPLVSIVDVLRHNKARRQDDVFVFELGKRYDENETMVVSGALMGTLRHNTWQQQSTPVDFYTLKGMLDSLFEAIELKQVRYEATDTYKNLHPGQSARLVVNEVEIGFIGKLHPEYEKAHDLARVYVFELDVKRLFELRRVRTKAEELPKFPEVERDLAIVVQQDVPAQAVLDVVNKMGKRLLVKSEIFDVYQGAPLADDEKSIAVRMVFQDKNKTLETKDVDQRVNDIIGILKAQLNATLR